jgi:hypothetical protein
MRKLLLAGVASFFSTGAMAVPLLSAGTIESGGLTFSNFSCTAPDPVGSTIGGCANIDVSALPGAGLTFATVLSTLAGDGAGEPNAIGQLTSGLDVVIGYTVTSPSLLTSIGLNFNGAVAGSTGFARITEQAFTDATRSQLLGTTTVGTVDGILSRNLTLDPGAFSAFIVKDIQLGSISTTGMLTTSTISTINQPYSSTPTPVPEPMSLALFGAGLLGLGVARRARKQA